jgi:nitrogen fixation NifU-like protein
MSGPADAPDERELAEFYRETIMRHSLEPVGFQAHIEATHENEQYNPLCGDRVTIRFQVRGDEIEAAAFDGAACAICLASASLVCAEAPGHSLDFVRSTHDWLQQALKGKQAEAGPKALQALLGVRRYPSRIKCAMLPWIAAIKALGA